MEINIEGMINKLEYDVNEFIIRNAELKKLKGLKDKLEAIYVNDNITMNREWKIKMYKNDH